jgi:RHS repeat-associated protein
LYQVFSDSVATQNFYDFENRMTQHGTGSGLLLAYDGDGNRVSETIGGTTTKFLVDDHNPTGLPQVLDELVNGSVTRTYAYGYGRLSENQQIGGNWTPSFYGYDGHLNVRFLSNTTASITDSYDYDGFGMPIRTSGSTPNVFLYSGERYDSSVGLYDLRARYYNQATGRFWARDPVEGFSCTPLTFNPYIYDLDEPVDRIDPTGQEAAVETLTLRWKDILTTSGQLVLAAALACAAEEDATGFGSIFYNLLTGSKPLNLQQAGPCVLKPKPRRGKPCSPVPAGELGYRLDPSQNDPHFEKQAQKDIFGVHWHLFYCNQRPPEAGCRCNWEPEKWVGNQGATAVGALVYGVNIETTPCAGGGIE